MKLSEELKIKRAEKVAEMQAILDARKTDGVLRAATTEEATKYDGLKAEVARMDTDIKDAEELEARGIDTPQTITAPAVKRQAKPYSVGKAIREFARGEDKLTGREKEAHDELSRGFVSSGLLVPFSRAASANTATTHATSIDVNIDPNLSILGYEPLWNQMGLTVLDGLQGQIKIGKKTHDVAGLYAESAEVVAESNVPSFVTLSPERYGITDLFTKELLAQENPAVQAAIVADMLKGIDRKISATVYTIALAAATEVAAGALTVAGFNALMAAVDADGSFLMDRGSFYAAKTVAVDQGSGRFLAQVGPMNGVGASHDGAKIFYSNLFADGTNQQYAIYGAMNEIYLGFWGALEVLINPYTYQNNGQIQLTVNRLADLACRNTAAFVKTPDLDSAT